MSVPVDTGSPEGVTSVCVKEVENHGILVIYGHYSKLPQTQQLKTTHTYCLLTLEARSPTWVPDRAEIKVSPRLRAADAFLKSRHLPSLCFHPHNTFCLFCGQISLHHQMVQNNLPTSRSSVPSAASSSPRRETFADRRDQEPGMFEGHYSADHTGEVRKSREFGPDGLRCTSWSYKLLPLCLPQCPHLLNEDNNSTSLVQLS